MEVRCAGCNKLFRVSDDKITGAGIKFPCSRCGNAVKITSEEFEQHKLSREAASALASFEPQPSQEAVAALFDTDGGSHQPEPTAAHPDFDLSDPASAAAAMQEEEQPPLFVMPEAAVEPQPAAPKPAPTQPKAQPMQAQAAKPVAAPPLPKAEPVAAPAASPPAAQPKVQSRPAQPVRPAPAEVKTAAKPASPSVRPASAPSSRGLREPAPVVVTASRPVHDSNAAMKVMIAVVAVIVLGSAGYFARSFFGGAPTSHSIDIGKEVTPQGLQILNASGGVDPVSGDLIISGTIENATDKARPAWYVIVDLLDAKGTTVSQARLVSGKYFYTRRDMEILVKRGINIQELKAKQLQDQGVVIPARGSVTFEIRVLEPPIGVANFNAGLHPFDPVKLYKEMSEAEK